MLFFLFLFLFLFSPCYSFLILFFFVSFFFFISSFYLLRVTTRSTIRQRLHIQDVHMIGSCPSLMPTCQREVCLMLWRIAVFDSLVGIGVGGRHADRRWHFGENICGRRLGRDSEPC
jgi:hypothetical protein